MEFVPSSIVEEMRGSHQLGIFLRVDTDPALHLWFGINDIPANFDSIDPTGTVYLGGGRLIGVPTLEILVNGTADSVEFTLSGLDPTTSAKMLDSLPPVRGAAVQMGLTTLDRYFQPMSSIIPIWTGTASHTGEVSPPVEEGDSPSITLSLAVVTGEATRSRGARSVWSTPHQKAISLTDKFCDGVSRLARGVQPVWPNFQG
ncbi:hypothetical protein U8C37_09400 [Sinorhizobium medicae]|uniref:hypothetical protein n=1 Tax=Sinorhizobium medicae TaxID=110321 RepID=UPI001AAD1288|nr:hypothetical protein [Sinorhizobium medicae]MBO1940161.1 hypothetical protein [Sinorhizobium medicae]MDX0930594.1 hypothetical protein [Sinorhizobium medicae]WQO60612.1 hypothetical protein U8C35_09520 [Sinorhizobium medicae]WQO87533.1 hypothetical protein U8C37_09400 [Sinorhizobium medicae]